MLISVRDIVRWSDSTTVFCSMRMSCNLLKVLKEYHILSNVVIFIKFFLQVSVQIKWTLIFLANLKKGFDVHTKMSSSLSARKSATRIVGIQRLWQYYALYPARNTCKFHLYFNAFFFFCMHQKSHKMDCF